MCGKGRCEVYEVKGCSFEEVGVGVKFIPGMGVVELRDRWTVTGGAVCEVIQPHTW